MYLRKLASLFFVVLVCSVGTLAKNLAVQAAEIDYDILQSDPGQVKEVPQRNNSSETVENLKESLHSFVQDLERELEAEQDIKPKGLNIAREDESQKDAENDNDNKHRDKRKKNHKTNGRKSVEKNTEDFDQENAGVSDAKSKGDYVDESKGEVKTDEQTPKKITEAPESKGDFVDESKEEVTTGEHEQAPEKTTEAKTTETPKERSFTMFTIANTDIGTDYEKIPYRERYLWNERDAPCHSFNLKVPDDAEERALITLCIFRPNLDFPDETKLFIRNVPNDDDNAPPAQKKVYGYVMNTVDSAVYGRIEDGLFYGEISIFENSTKLTTIFVVEDIKLLNRLMRNNDKTLKHMLMIMQGKEKNKDKMRTVYNAVVTKGASLIDFMVFTNPNDINRNSFIMFSTNHNSYICPGEPVMEIDENGHIKIESGSNTISVDNDGRIHMTTKDKSYTFRPNGRTIISEGIHVRTLQEHEGSVAITAFTKTSMYDCVLPSPAFKPNRLGGYVCKVCLAVDDSFTKHYIEKLQDKSRTASNFLGHIIDRVSWMLRSVDFDDDQKSDNIGVDYDSQYLQWIYPDNSTENLTEQDAEVLFQSLGGLDFTECCIGIGFTMKNLPNNEFASRPNSNENEKPVSPSGVCAGGIGNLIIISANNKRGNFDKISENELIYLTANQIAGAFGASPDGAGGDDDCDQFIDEHQQPRHYLMWPDVLRNTTLKEQGLSSCSKKDIVKTLSKCKSSCFDVDRHPFCGNGIVEEGEECDCGDELNCKLQTCCYSRIGKYPCRKSGIGCKSDSSASSLLAQKGLLFVAIGVLTILAIKAVNN